MPRPPRYATLLTLYGVAGLVALTLLTGLVARGLHGATLPETAARFSVVAASFLAWLYAWRRLTLLARRRACGVNRHADSIGEAAGARRHSGRH